MCLVLILPPFSYSKGGGLCQGEHTLPSLVNPMDIHHWWRLWYTQTHTHTPQKWERRRRKRSSREKKRAGVHFLRVPRVLPPVSPKLSITEKRDFRGRDCVSRSSRLGQEPLDSLYDAFGILEKSIRFSSIGQKVPRSQCFMEKN